MSPRNWYEFSITHNQHAQTLLPNLRKFIHTKYIHEENTAKREKYGKLCNIAKYPLYFKPYEEDFSAKIKLTFDPKKDNANFLQPSTFIQRKFGGSHFPVHMSTDEDTERRLTSQHAILPNIHDNGGLEIDTIPQDLPYGLYHINEAGKMVSVTNKLN